MRAEGQITACLADLVKSDYGKKNEIIEIEPFPLLFLKNITAMNT